MITISAWNWVPDFARGLVRDLPVRWALEEAGLSYTAKVIGRPDQASAQYREWQPFRQVPAFDDGVVRLFESGAIVLYIAEQSRTLLPQDAALRAQATSWVIAALNSIDPVIRSFHLVGDSDEAPALAEKVGALLTTRLAAVATALGDKDYLTGSFTAGDLMMAFIMRNLRTTERVTADPILGPYLARCEARPAFQRALAAQLADFLPEPPAM